MSGVAAILDTDNEDCIIEVYYCTDIYIGMASTCTCIWGFHFFCITGLGASAKSGGKPGNKARFQLHIMSQLLFTILFPQPYQLE